MVKVIFIEHDGTEHHAEGQAGDTLLQVAVNNNVPGILGDCGGCLSCATCHVHVADDWLGRVGQAGGMEKDMLDMAIDPDEKSRLSCQITLGEDSEGIKLYIPKVQS